MRMSGAEFRGMVEVIAALAREVGLKQTRLIESRVRLGWTILSLRGRATRQEVDGVLVEAQVHPRRASEAVRLAEAYADSEGNVDWDKWKAACAAKAGAREDQPSVRSMLGVLRGPKVVEEEDPDQVVLIEGPDDEVDEDHDHAAPPGEAAVGLDDEMDEGVTFVDAELEDEGPEARDAAWSVAADAGERGLVGVMGGSSLGTVTRPFVVGAQMSMDDLYTRASGLADDLCDVLRRIGFEDSDEMVRPIRERLTAAAAL